MGVCVSLSMAATAGASGGQGVVGISGGLLYVYIYILLIYIYYILKLYICYIVKLYICYMVNILMVFI